MNEQDYDEQEDYREMYHLDSKRATRGIVIGLCIAATLWGFIWYIVEKQVK